MIYESFVGELKEGVQSSASPEPPSVFIKETKYQIPQHDRPKKSKRKEQRKRAPDPRITKAPDSLYKKSIIDNATSLLSDPLEFLNTFKRGCVLNPMNFLLDPTLLFTVKILSGISLKGGREATPANNMLDVIGLSHFKYPFPQHEGLWYYKRYPEALKQSVENYKAKLLSHFRKCAESHNPTKGNREFKTGDVEVFPCCLEHALVCELDKHTKWGVFCSSSVYQKDITHAALLFLAHKECESKFPQLVKIWKERNKKRPSVAGKTQLVNIGLYLTPEDEVVYIPTDDEIP